MRKALIVAWREFTATVMTKGFVIGVLLMPTVAGLVVALLPLLIEPPDIKGSLAIIDRTGRVVPYLVDHLDKGISLPKSATGDRTAPSKLTLEVLPPDADAEAAAVPLRHAGQRGGRLGVIVIDEGALSRDTPFELFVAPRLDILLESALTEEIANAIVDARIAASGYDPERIHEMLKRPSWNSRVITASGRAQPNEVARMLLPGAFMLLLWVATITAGQTLLATLVEEKSLRVTEVLLSAVSPVELLVGKILGHGGVGMCVLAVYLGLGLVSLSMFGALHLLVWSNVLLLAVFFLIAFLFIASVMAAIGSAVDDMRAAQSLLTPVMLIFALPTVLWLPITRNPSAPFAVLLSFIPPIGPFVTVLRLAGRDPVPLWQLALSIGLGSVAVVFAVWAASKIFRIGVLMYGKPPSLRMLLRWIDRGASGAVVREPPRAPVRTD